MQVSDQGEDDHADLRRKAVEIDEDCIVESVQASIGPDWIGSYSLLSLSLSLSLALSLSLLSVLSQVEQMRTNPDDFAPFVEDDESFDRYLDRMESEGTWGGNMELQALSMALKRNIVLHQV